MIIRKARKALSLLRSDRAEFRRKLDEYNFLSDRRVAFHLLQMRVRKPEARARLAGLLAKVRPSASASVGNAYPAQVLDQVFDDGFSTELDLLTPAQASEIRAYFEGIDELFDPYRPLAQDGRFSHRSPPADTRIGHYRPEVVLSAPHVLEMANDPRLLHLLGQAFGCKPTLDYMAAWWSFPGHEAPEEAQFFHRDSDGLDFLKVFIYLTEVDEDAGPHVFVRESHRRDELSGVRRYADDEVEAVAGKRIVRFTGPAGTHFIENTFGLHKGQPPKTTKRLLLQFLYSAGRTPYGPRKPVGHARDLPPGLAGRLDPYVNRVYVAGL